MHRQSELITARASLDRADFGLALVRDVFALSDPTR